jgi:histidine ammonia-lyase
VLTLDGHGLTLADVRRVLHDPGLRIAISTDARERVRASRAVVDAAIDAGDAVYGVTTGFGKLQDQMIDGDQRLRLQRNLVRSHACGVGPLLDEATARLVFLLRIQSIIRGHSGVTERLVDRLVALWNSGLAPAIPEQGSVGASGDLAPLAHLALGVTGEGHWVVDGHEVDAPTALRAAGLETEYTLLEKEGLALLNGTQLSTAIGLAALIQSDDLLRHADLATAMTIDGLLFSAKPFRPSVQAVRPHPGQAVTGSAVQALLHESDILMSHPGPHKVQDAYSVRCAPQVHGAIRDALSHVRDVLVREANSTTDNPLVFPDIGQVVSGGNFHAEPVALACDYMANGVAELGSISERRIESLVNPDLSNLPAFLAPEPGVCSGMMMAQVTAAALVSENKTLAHPASVDSIPTSANQEDHVSMAPIAARKARQICENTQTVLAIELLAAAEAIEYRRPLLSGTGVEAAHEVIRSHVPRLTDDRVLSADMETIAALMSSGALLEAAEEIVGPLIGLHPAD